MARDMTLEKKIDLLVDGFAGLSGKVDGLSIQVTELKSDVTELKGDVGELKVEMGGLKNYVGGLEVEMGGLRGELGKLSSKVDVGFEESHRLLKMSLEALGAFQETTDSRFDKVSHEHAQQFDLLEKVGLHVRRRVERLEGRAPRRRR